MEGHKRATLNVTIVGSIPTRNLNPQLNRRPCAPLLIESRKLSKKWSALYWGFPLPTLLYARYNLKLKKKLSGYTTFANQDDIVTHLWICYLSNTFILLFNFLPFANMNFHFTRNLRRFIKIIQRFVKKIFNNNHYFLASRCIPHTVGQTEGTKS